MNHDFDAHQHLLDAAGKTTAYLNDEDSVEAVPDWKTSLVGAFFLVLLIFLVVRAVT